MDELPKYLCCEQADPAGSANRLNLTADIAQITLFAFVAPILYAPFIEAAQPSLSDRERVLGIVKAYTGDTAPEMYHIETSSSGNAAIQVAMPVLISTPPSSGPNPKDALPSVMPGAPFTSGNLQGNFTLTWVNPEGKVIVVHGTQSPGTISKSA